MNDLWSYYGSSRISKRRTALEGRRLGICFGRAVSWYMSSIKPFKTSRPQFSYLSHGQMGLGELETALTLVLCLEARLGVVV